MLDLYAGVHLDEIELAVVVEELDRAGAFVVHLAHGVGADLADLEPLRQIERGRGAFLEDLLMAALQRTIAFAEMDRMALAIAENLNFDMARIVEKFFEIDGIIAKGRLGFAARGGERVRQVLSPTARPSCRARRRRRRP